MSTVHKYRFKDNSLCRFLDTNYPEALVKVVCLSFEQSASCVENNKSQGMLIMGTPRLIPINVYGRNLPRVPTTYTGTVPDAFGTR